jgi:hypothetical protein
VHAGVVISSPVVALIRNVRHRGFSGSHVGSTFPPSPCRRPSSCAFCSAFPFAMGDLLGGFSKVPGFTFFWRSAAISSRLMRRREARGGAGDDRLELLRERPMGMAADGQAARWLPTTPPVPDHGGRCGPRGPASIAPRTQRLPAPRDSKSHDSARPLPTAAAAAVRRCWFRSWVDPAVCPGGPCHLCGAVAPAATGWAGGAPPARFLPHLPTSPPRAVRCPASRGGHGGRQLGTRLSLPGARRYGLYADFSHP